MRKSFVYWAVVMAVAAMAAGCQKDGLEITPEEPAVEPERTDGLPKGAFRLTTEGDEGGTKTMAIGNQVNWVEGDVVNVNGNDYAIKLSNGHYYIEPGADGTPLITGDKIYGYYNCGDVKDRMTTSPKVTIPSEYECLIDNSKNETKEEIALPMAAYGDRSAGTIQFKQLTAALSLTIHNYTGFPLRLDEVTLSCSNCQFSGSTTLSLSDAGYGLASQGGSGSVTLHIKGIAANNRCFISNGGSVTVQVPFRPVNGATINILVRANSNLGAVRGFHGANQDSDDILGVLNPNYEFRYSYTPEATLTLGRNQMMTASVTLKRAADSIGRVTEVDHGLFSISDYYKVHFSKGNLKYYATASAGEKWQFADNQFNYVGNVNVNITQGDNNSQPIDLFGWATSGHNNGQLYYQPYSYSNDNSGYYGNSSWWNGDRPYSMDWGYNLNILPNYENKNIIWYTLGADAWTYLLDRDKGKKWGNGTVADVKGCILLPDDWVQPAGVPNFIPKNWEGNYNNYTPDEWAYMAKAGAVFLPAAGCRDYDEGKVIIDNAGVFGYYWTCNYDTENYYAKYLHIKSGEPQIVTHKKRFGFSVRLVTRLDGSN